MNAQLNEFPPACTSTCPETRPRNKMLCSPSLQGSSPSAPFPLPLSTPITSLSLPACKDDPYPDSDVTSKLHLLLTSTWMWTYGASLAVSLSFHSPARLIPVAVVTVPALTSTWYLRVSICSTYQPSPSCVQLLKCCSGYCVCAFYVRCVHTPQRWRPPDCFPEWMFQFPRLRVVFESPDGSQPPQDLVLSVLFILIVLLEMQWCLTVSSIYSPPMTRSLAHFHVYWSLTDLLQKASSSLLPISYWCGCLFLMDS